MKSTFPPISKQKIGVKELWHKFKAVMSTKDSSSRPEPSAESLLSRNEDDVEAATAGSALSPAAQSNSIEHEEQLVVGIVTDDKSAVAESTVIVNPTATQHEDVLGQERRVTQLPLAVDAIEVDDAESAGEEYVHLSYRLSFANFPSIPIPEASTTRHIISKKHSFENAKAVFARYNQSLDAADWRTTSRPTIDRVEKRTRMRVRYTCHECQKTFGSQNTCSKCGHDRCHYCHRYPPKRDKQRREQISRPAPELPTSSITTGLCHQCKTSFEISDADCNNCQHTICERCLRESLLRPSTSIHHHHLLSNS